MKIGSKEQKKRERERREKEEKRSLSRKQQSKQREKQQALKKARMKEEHAKKAELKAKKATGKASYTGWDKIWTIIGCLRLSIFIEVSFLSCHIATTTMVKIHEIKYNCTG